MSAGQNQGKPPESGAGKNAVKEQGSSSEEIAGEEAAAKSKGRAIAASRERRKRKGRDSDQNKGRGEERGEEGDKLLETASSAGEMGVGTPNEEVFEYAAEHFGVLNGAWERAAGREQDYFVCVDPKIRTRKNFNLHIVKNWWIFRGEERPAYLAPVKIWRFRKVRPEKVEGFENLPDCVREYLEGLLPGAKKTQGNEADSTGVEESFVFTSPVSLVISVSEAAQDPALGLEEILKNFCHEVGQSLKGASVSVFMMSASGQPRFLTSCSEAQSKAASKMHGDKRIFLEKRGSRVCLGVVLCDGDENAIGGIVTELDVDKADYLGAQAPYLAQAGIAIRGCLLEARASDFLLAA